MKRKDTETAAPAHRSIRQLWQGIRQSVGRALDWYNSRLKKIYSPNVAALTGTLLVMAMAVFILFVPSFSGMADDGSLSRVMKQVGLGYRLSDLEDPTGAYFVRLYLHSNAQPQGLSSHAALIKAAMFLDDQFTHDNFFDIRFLALLYLILYLPAVYLVFRGIASRVKVAAEATFLVVLGAVMLGDAAAVSYFNSLYPEAMWQVFLMYCLGMCLAMQHEKASWTQGGLMGLAVCGSVLALTESHCAAVGFVLTVFCVRQVFIENRTGQISAIAMTCAVVLLAASTLSAVAGTDRFTESSKMHAMTNGVLLRSQNPEKTLEEFGIDPRFETLADASAYADYPYALPGNQEIQRDFLSRYSAGTIALHYLRDPMAYFGLLELSVSASFSPMRDYVGSFEKSAGKPPWTQYPFLTYYSSFKGNSLPRTMGFLVILLGAYWVLFRQRRGLQHFVTRWTFRERQIMLDTFLMLFLAGLAHLSGIIALSGTAELERYKMLCGACVDGMVLLFVSEVMHRLNTFSSEE